MAWTISSSALSLLVFLTPSASFSEGLLSSRYAPELQRLIPFATTHLERLSLAHQNDLLRALNDPELLKNLTRAHVNLDGLRAGIVDSDAGKLRSVFESAILIPSPASSEFLNFLKGLSPETKAGKALAELLDASGFAGKGLLNKELSNVDIRAVLNKHPLLQSFLHELPGMMDAMNDVNAVPPRITPEQFKKRIGANLFHNDGPGHQVPRGFWQSEMTGKLVPTLLLSDRDPRVRSFFEFTVFAGFNDANAVLPRYHTPVTVEGVFHAILDRVSQGSRGGIGKIFVQNGARAEDADFVLRRLPDDTILQLEAFLEALESSVYLTLDQKSAAEDVIQKFLQRLRRQSAFLKQSTHIIFAENQIRSIVLQYQNPAGHEVHRHLDMTSPRDLEGAIHDLLETEEALHGDAMLLSGRKPAAQGC